MVSLRKYSIFFHVVFLIVLAAPVDAQVKSIPKYAAVFQKATETLELNRMPRQIRGHSGKLRKFFTTLPALGLYPFQWGWDAGFIAIGYARYANGQALEELEALFQGQWKDGMLPHIVFGETEKSDQYFPGPQYWQSEKAPLAPATHT